MKIILNLIFTLLLAVNIKAQSILVKSFELIDQSITSSSVVKYPDNYHINKIESFNEVKNNSPEHSLASYFSANNAEWFDYNLRIKKTLPYHNFQQVIDKEFSIHPRIKLSFTANGSEHAIIKFEIRQYNKIEYSYALHFEQNNNLWYVSDASICTNLHLFFVLIDAKYLYSVLIGRMSDNPTFNKLLDKNMLNGRLNFDTFLVDITELYNDDLIEFEKISDPHFNL